MTQGNETKIDIVYNNYNVLCLLSSCSTNKKYSLHQLDATQAKAFINKLLQIEEMTWKQLAGLPPENGLAPEIINSESFEMIKSCDRHIVEGEPCYYFHLRVSLKFRIFGYQHEQYFYITHIDKNHKIQKS